MKLGLALPALRPSRREPPGPFNFEFSDTRLQYRHQGETSWQVETGEAMNLPNIQWIVHTVKLTALNPDSTIEIRLPQSSNPFSIPQHVYCSYCEDPTTTLVVHWLTVGPIQEDYTGFGLSYDVKSFTQPATLGPGEPYRCVQISDTHGRDSCVPIFPVIGALDAKLIIHSGDMATGDGGLRPGGAATWSKLFEAIDGAVDTQGRRVPIIPCDGNHENRGGSTGRARRPPPEPFPYKPDFKANQRGWLEWYFGFFPTFPPLPDGFGVLDFGDYMSLCVLSPGASTISDPDPELGDLEQDQAQWLDNTLAARQHIPNRFSTLHYSPYPAGRRPMASFTLDIREKWGPVWHSNGCGLVFFGHEHTMSRTVPIGYWGRDGHQIDLSPTPGGVVFAGGGPGRWTADGTGEDVVGGRQGRNKQTKWWIEFQRATEIEYYFWEQEGADIRPSSIELRDPHPDDGNTLSNAEVAHLIQVDLGYQGRTIQFIDSLGNVADSFAQSADPNLSGT